ncbi:hypothetical protein DSBG_3898 [Desulfosporosinus sp. BG]|nr:hypothetical protein DSBG_3898 [Desulfosporosinus sp. BG]
MFAHTKIIMFVRFIVPDNEEKLAKDCFASFRSDQLLYCELPFKF